MTDRVSWGRVFGLVLFAAATGFLCVRAVQPDAPWDSVQNQPATAAEWVAQNAEHEHIPVTPDLEADQLFREFQAYRHWGLGGK